MKLSDLAREEREEAIIRSAIKVFATHGYYNSRVSDIAKDAKIAYGLFYHYFESKDDILLKIFQNSWKRLIREINIITERTSDPVIRIRELTKYIFRTYEEFPDLMKVLIMDVPRLTKFYDKKNQNLYNSFFIKVADIISEGKTNGVFKDEAPPLLMAQILIGAIDSIIRHHVFNIIHGKRTVFKSDDIIRQFQTVVIEGLKN